jgi:hypothetical protein
MPTLQHLIGLIILVRCCVLLLCYQTTTSLFVWLIADGWCWFVPRDKYCWLVATSGWFVLREKYCWLVADKPSEQGR